MNSMFLSLEREAIVGGWNKGGSKISFHQSTSSVNQMKSHKNSMRMTFLLKQ